MQATTPQTGHDFYAMLRAREAQAAQFGRRHLAAVPDRNSMLFWLAEAAKDARLAAKRKQVHVAASAGAGVDQSTIARFEKHIAWPRDVDIIVQAYADDLDVAAVELWDQALKKWRADLAATAEIDAATQAIGQAGQRAPRQRRKA
jgi:hypothetical protein